MKIKFLFPLLAAFGLIACGGSDEAIPATTPEETATEEAAEAVAEAETEAEAAEEAPAAE